MLDAVLPTTAGVLCIESQAELTLVLARASGPIPQAATCRLRAVLVAAVSSRARRTGGTLHFYCPTPVGPYRANFKKNTKLMGDLANKLDSGPHQGNNIL